MSCSIACAKRPSRAGELGRDGRRAPHGVLHARQQVQVDAVFLVQHAGDLRVVGMAVSSKSTVNQTTGLALSFLAAAQAPGRPQARQRAQGEKPPKAMAPVNPASAPRRASTGLPRASAAASSASAVRWHATCTPSDGSGVSAEAVGPRRRAGRVHRREEGQDARQDAEHDAQQRAEQHQTRAGARVWKRRARPPQSAPQQASPASPTQPMRTSTKERPSACAGRSPGVGHQHEVQQHAAGRRR